MHHFLPAACCLLAATAASAQTVYVDADRTVAGGNPLNNSASATVNAGRIQSYNAITVLDATGAGTVLTLNGGLSTGAVRAFGSTVRLNGGDYATLHALSTIECQQPADQRCPSGGAKPRQQPGPLHADRQQLRANQCHCG